MNRHQDLLHNNINNKLSTRTATTKYKINVLIVNKVYCRHKVDTNKLVHNNNKIVRNLQKHFYVKINPPILNERLTRVEQRRGVLHELT